MASKYYTTLYTHPLYVTGKSIFFLYQVIYFFCNNHGLIKKHKRNYCGSVQKHSSMRYIVGTFNTRESLVAVSG